MASPAWKGALLTALFSLALILALGSYESTDPSLNTFSSARAWKEPGNVLGYFGSFLADLFFQVFGWSAWLWPALLSVELGRWLRDENKSRPVFRLRDGVGLGLALGGSALLLELMDLSLPAAGFPAPGLLGIALATASVPFFGSIGSYFVAALFFWFFCMIWWDELPLLLLRFCRRVVARTWQGLTALARRLSPNWVFNPGWRLNFRFQIPWSLRWPARSKAAPASAAVAPQEVPEVPTLSANEPSTFVPIIRNSQEEEEQSLTTASPRKSKTQLPRSADETCDWTLPPLSLLQTVRIKVKPASEEQMLATANKITNALKSFDIEGEVVEVSPGPVITMYEFQPGPGVRVQKLVSASTDLAMTLGVPSVRVVAPIPGKSVAGIEVPNNVKEEIVLKDVYEQTLERSKPMKLPLVLGRDIEGKPVIEDLARMPHLLVGGATSMGKSVLVNSILTSLLCRFSPNDLRLIIVDPKLVEFKIFEDLPHLLLPIVNDAADASQALKWAVAETKRRYVEMQKVAAKNLEAFNLKSEQKIPYIVIIIDELAELMLTAKKDVEQSIVRLSQLARAAGIHLVMATQRPSADVVTGLIKSNCPSRAALRVASASDSRIILDCSGAEQLLGKGDLFFTNTGPMGLRRMQGCFVSDEEIEKICDFWREQGEPSYKEEILAPELSPEEQSEFEGASGTDPLYAEVIEFAKERGRISTSLIQRRFQIGYTRAARIMEQLEARGVVSEQSAAGKAREVII